MFNLESIVSVDFTESAEPVVPRGAIRPVPLDVTYVVNRGVFGRGILEIYKSKTAFIKLEIIDHSEWVTAILAKDTVAIPVSTELTTSGTTVKFQVHEDAPAYKTGYITIKASVGQMGLIQGYSEEFTLTFVPSYKPIISPSLPETNTRKIGPMDTATFPVEIENMGNARTIVFLNVSYVPKGWNAIITSQLILEEGVGSKATAYLVVKPPKGFGYHSEEETIRISMTPARIDDQSDQGVTIYENFLVESQGFSTYGFEAVLPFVLVIILVIALVFYWFTKRRK